ncbi:hypothetical protein TI05_05690 [Achromatium sp. WMS3]|nr:hypothetical protein TI05_05690 [Achromatium sp. WMS3]
MKKFSILLIIMMLNSIVYATTWRLSHKTDPLTGDSVSCQEITSFGGYIYHWPSKYDLVFWPWTSSQWIIMNKRNGYAAFNSHFEKVPDAQKPALRKWLAANYDPQNPPSSHKEKLLWLEKVYSQRHKNDEFWSHFYRIMVYIHRDDENIAKVYIKKTLPLLEKSLQSASNVHKQLEALYLLGEYHLRLKNFKQAKEYFEQVKQIDHPYFNKLVKDRWQRLELQKH